jgi:hypothetical protein
MEYTPSLRFIFADFPSIISFFLLKKPILPFVKIGLGMFIQNKKLHVCVCKCLGEKCLGNGENLQGGIQWLYDGYRELQVVTGSYRELRRRYTVLQSYGLQKHIT